MPAKRPGRPAMALPLLLALSKRLMLPGTQVERPSTLADEIDHRVAHEPVQPGIERRLACERRERPVESDEHLLNAILDVGVGPEQLAQLAGDPRPVEVVALAESEGRVPRHPRELAPIKRQRTEPDRACEEGLAELGGRREWVIGRMCHLSWHQRCVDTLHDGNVFPCRNDAHPEV